MPDWGKIRAEYIRGGISYRKLAEKHSVSFNTLRDIARTEEWVSLRDKAHDKAMTKTVEKISDRQAEKASRIDDIADKLLDKLETAVDEIDLEVRKHKLITKDEGGEHAIEYIEVSDKGIVDRAGLLKLVDALAKLKDIKGELSELDRKEKEARIENLRQKNVAEEPVNLTVVLEGDLEKYAH